jgi:hypothetical protein
VGGFTNKGKQAIGSPKPFQAWFNLPWFLKTPAGEFLYSLASTHSLHNLLFFPCPVSVLTAPVKG